MKFMVQQDLFANTSNNMGVSFTINPVLTGVYTLVVTDANGCVDSAEVNFLPSSFLNLDFINEINIYPNPSRDIFYLSFNSEDIQDLSIRILNVVGEEVYRESKEQFIGQYTKQISLDNYGKGFYLLEINTSAGILNKKLILQ